MSVIFFANVLTNDFLLQKPENTTSQPPSNQQAVEVQIPHIGKFMIESKEGGYDDEVPWLQCSARFAPTLCQYVQAHRHACATHLMSVAAQRPALPRA